MYTNNTWPNIVPLRTPSIFYLSNEVTVRIISKNASAYSRTICHVASIDTKQKTTKQHLTYVDHVLIAIQNKIPDALKLNVKRNRDGV